MYSFRIRAKRKLSTLTKITENLIRNLPLNPTQLHQQHQQQQQNRQRSDTSKNPSKPPEKTYNTPHPPKDPPDGYNPKSFKHIAFDAPNYLPYSIWRPFQANNERLGPNAAKSAQYKNPEYYSYHRFSFFETQRNVLELRKKKAEGGDIKTVYDYEIEEDVEIGLDGKVSDSKSCAEEAPKKGSNDKSPKESKVSGNKSCTAQAFKKGSHDKSPEDSKVSESKSCPDQVPKKVSNDKSKDSKVSESKSCDDQASKKGSNDKSSKESKASENKSCADQVPKKVSNDKSSEESNDSNSCECKDDGSDED